MKIKSTIILTAEIDLNVKIIKKKKKKSISTAQYGAFFFPFLIYTNNTKDMSFILINLYNQPLVLWLIFEGRNFFFIKLPRKKKKRFFLLLE